MEIKINDKKIEIAEGATVSDALAVMEIHTAGIATALNGKVIPSSSRDKAVLKAGDSIVVIKAFYGG